MTEHEIRHKRSLYRKNLKKALDHIVQRASEMPEVEKLILFGSYAAGRQDLFTDLDLIVVMETEQDIIRRSANLYQKFQAGVDLDLLVYTPDEFERERTSGFLRHAVATGRVVYEKKRAL